MRRLLVMLLLVTGFAALFFGQLLAQRSQADAAITQLISAMTDAFNRHEPDTALMTPDADFVNVQGLWLHGITDIQRGRAARFQTALKNARIRIVDVQVRFIRPDVAIAHVTDEITGMRNAEGTELPAQRELSLRVFTRENGRWLVTAFHNTPLLASR
jgi:uncharacterized protein (TIGR02246 family)